MSYWNANNDGNDFAFGSIGANIYLIKERLFKEMNLVNEKLHPEQSIICQLTMLRIIGEQFPESLSIHFDQNDFNEVKKSFYSWYESGAKIPAKYRTDILLNAEKEFELFESTIIKDNN